MLSISPIQQYIPSFNMCFGGREDVEAKKSREIDALIHRDEKVMQRQVKLLLLGESAIDLSIQLPPSTTTTEIPHEANHDRQQVRERVGNRRY